MSEQRSGDPAIVEHVHSLLAEAGIEVPDEDCLRLVPFYRDARAAADRLYELEEPEDRK